MTFLIGNDEQLPQTTAERRAAERRKEAALLYEKSFDRRRRSFIRDPPHPQSLTDTNTRTTTTSACTGVGGQLCEDGVPLIQRLMRGDFHEPRGAAAKGPSPAAVDDGKPPVDRVTVASAASECPPPLRLLHTNWSHYDAPQRPEWCGHSAARPAMVVSNVSAAATRQQPALSRPSSAATVRSWAKGDAWAGHRAAGRLTATPRNRPQSSSSSLITHNTQISRTTTVMAIAPRREMGGSYKSKAKGLQTQGAPAMRQSKKLGRNSAGSVILSKEEYQRLQQLLS